MKTIQLVRAGKRSFTQRQLRWSALASVTLAAVALTGCNDIVGERCDQICKCQNCGERERQECEVKSQAAVDTADAYRCSDLLEPLYACQVQKHECTDGHYSDDNKECKDAEDQYKQCLEAQSSRRQGAYDNYDNY